MSSRPGRNPPIPPSLRPGFAPLPSIPPSAPPSENTQRRPLQPQNAPNMAPMNGSGPTSPRRRGHHRSISHPFVLPSAVGGKKRDKAAVEHGWDSDSDSDDMPFHLPSLATSPRKDAPKKVPGNNVLEGSCPTCNSTVRWPRNSEVFRCTACLMVTDLQDESPSKGKEPGDRDLEDEPPARTPPMSVSRLNNMINGDVSAYLDRLLAPWPGSDQTRHGRHHHPNGDSSTHASRPDHLPLPRDPRNRSLSASSGQERFDVTKENANLSIPPKPHWENNASPVRNRAHSDVQSGSKADRPPQETARPADEKVTDREHQPKVFQRVENYIITAFKGCNTLNSSFSTHQSSIRSASSGSPPKMKFDHSTLKKPEYNAPVFEPDAKTLLLGDLAENSSWWMHEWARVEGHFPPAAKQKGKEKAKDKTKEKPKEKSKEKAQPKSRLVSSRSPRINWTEVAQWYHLILTAGSTWAEQWATKKPDPGNSERDRARNKRWESINPSVIEKEIMESRIHLQRTLMKATENLLKRPRRVPTKAEDTRWLFILLANPLLSSPGSYAQYRTTQPLPRDGRRPSRPKDSGRPTTRDGKSPHKDNSVAAARSNSSSNHYGLLKRILGLMANLSNDCHHYFVSWYCRFPTGLFERLVELVGGFLTYRLTRQHGRKRPEVAKDSNELIPSFASAAGNTPAALHASLNRRSPPKKPDKKKESPIVYAEDWQIRAAARTMSLLFTANLSHVSCKADGASSDSRAVRAANLAGNHAEQRQDYVVPISSFYNTLLDYSDLLADFEIWESRSSKFSFCQYPFLLSIWAKIHIMEHDARRQMEVKAREAFFNSILNHRAVSQYLVLKVRRECLVEDSLRGVSEVVGTGPEEIKKGLRIEFLGEEGIDAGGLRKEWFLLLVREVFDPHHGESHPYASSLQRT